MVDFWSTLTELIKQYTVADTANVFTIVGGIATVVAAVGAIIAVVVTKGIAKEQIEIARKQNEISDKQADIALQQNCIALYEKREMSNIFAHDFFGTWNTFGTPKRLENIKSLPYSLLAIYISFRKLGMYNEEFVADKDWFYLIGELSGISSTDFNEFGKIMHLFSWDEQRIDFLHEVIEKYGVFNNQIKKIKSSKDSTQDVEISIEALFKMTCSQGCKDFLGELSMQCIVGYSN